MARRKPPTSPMTFSPGTCTAVEHQLAGVHAAHAHLAVGATDLDALPIRSTMKAVTESWARLSGSPVLAKTVYQSASRTPDIQHLVPVTTQPPADVWIGHGPGAHPHHVAARLGLGESEARPVGYPSLIPGR